MDATPYRSPDVSVLNERSREDLNHPLTAVSGILFVQSHGGDSAEPSVSSDELQIPDTAGR